MGLALGEGDLCCDADQVRRRFFLRNCDNDKTAKKENRKKATTTKRQIKKIFLIRYN
jgi:hypothetical protein